MEIRMDTSVKVVVIYEIHFKRIITATNCWALNSEHNSSSLRFADIVSLVSNVNVFLRIFLLFGRSSWGNTSLVILFFYYNIIIVLSYFVYPSQI